MIRPAIPSDETRLAALHWASWRATYRTILPAGFVDGALGSHIAAIWAGRFAREANPDLILLAEGPDGLEGFVAAFAEEAALYIDNLHAAPGKRGRRTGPRLLGAVARLGLAQGLTSAYLWVLDGNDAACRFYAALGARVTARQIEDLWGYPTAETRYDWDDLAALAAACDARAAR